MGFAYTVRAEPGLLATRYCFDAIPRRIRLAMNACARLDLTQIEKDVLPVLTCDSII